MREGTEPAGRPKSSGRELCSRGDARMSPGLGVQAPGSGLSGWGGSEHPGFDALVGREKGAMLPTERRAKV